MLTACMLLLIMLLGRWNLDFRMLLVEKKVNLSLNEMPYKFIKLFIVKLTLTVCRYVFY